MNRLQDYQCYCHSRELSSPTNSKIGHQFRSFSHRVPNLYPTSLLLLLEMRLDLLSDSLQSLLSQYTDILHRYSLILYLQLAC